MSKAALVVVGWRNLGELWDQSVAVFPSKHKQMEGAAFGVKQNHRFSAKRSGRWQGSCRPRLNLLPIRVKEGPSRTERFTNTSSRQGITWALGLQVHIYILKYLCLHKYILGRLGRYVRSQSEYLSTYSPT